MRVLLWHGWLLEGSGSNIFTARVAQALRDRGHDVVVMCQERDPAHYPFVDRFGAVGPDGLGELLPTLHRRLGDGSVTMLRPDIGPVLPVFVIDEYEGFDTVRRFVDLADPELTAYLEANVATLGAVAAWHRPELALAGHAIPGAVVAHRALGPGRYVAKVYGSDLEYAVRLQDRYRILAAEGLAGASSVAGSTMDVLRRAAELVPAVRDRLHPVAPGVDVDRFHPMDRRAAFREVADLLDEAPETARGRPGDLGDRTPPDRLDASARSYDQEVPDPGAAARLRALGDHRGPVVGYFGKLIPQKGVHLFLQALATLPSEARGLVVGFGLFREWLEALATALAGGDDRAVRRLGVSAPFDVELTDREIRSASSRPRTVFTGRLDHRFAPAALAGMDVLVVPSILDEAFGMVAAEGAGAGALPLVARHSGLAEVASALEREVGRPGAFSFEPGPGSVGRMAEGIRALLSLPPQERNELRRAVSAFVAREWSWDRTTDRLLALAP
jgi:glycosyltransferase involved in cell wall biosynthesis